MLQLLCAPKKEAETIFNMFKRLRFLLIISCLSILVKAQAQFDAPKSIELGPHGGMSYYIGDLNPAKHFAQPSWQAGVVVRYNQSNRWVYRLDYTYANVQASDEVIKWRPERGLNFFSTIHDLSLMVEFNFLEYYTGNPKKNFSPYLFAGISGFMFNPCRVTDSAMYELQPLQTEGESYSKFDVSIPFGFGFKMSLSKHICASLEWRLQKTFTDYLDDCGTVYPIEHAVLVKRDKGFVFDHVDPNEPYDGEGEIVFDYTDPTGKYKEAGMQRGNSAYKDWFGIVGVSITWKFNLPDTRGCNLSKF